MKTKNTPLDAYVLRYGFVREKIEHLQQLADQYFGHDPNTINWNNVSDLERLDEGLDNLLARFTESPR